MHHRVRAIDGMPTGRRRIAAVRWVGGVLVLVSLGGCSDRFGAPRAASKQGSDILDLWRVLFVVAAAIGVLVAGLILWSIVHYRKRPGEEAATFHANIPLEVFYTAVPLVIVAVIFVLTLRTQDDVTQTTSRPDVTVEVTAFQWGWRFVYPDLSVTVVGNSNQPPTLVLPVGRTARLQIDSPDVIHSFYVPAFLTKRDAIPGVPNRIDVTPTEIGRYNGYCAEFCGLDHTRMGFTAHIVTEAEFQAWLNTNRSPATTAPIR